jgi:hypothetical protein
MQLLSDLQRAFQSGLNVSELKNDLSSRIQLWEQPNSYFQVPQASPLPLYPSVLSTPSPVPHSESSYGSSEFAMKPMVS